MRTNQATSFKLIERPIYGSSRLGIDNTQLELIGYTAPTSGITTYELGLKQYELTNHLGNVLSTVSDKKIPHTTNGTDIDYYLADITSATDYYPFGSPMDGRTFSSEKYRFGFNGQEKDDEVAGAGNTNTAMFWEYDTRLGRRWNLDPEGSPDLSAYSCYSGNPILRIDPFGNTDFINSKGECVATDGNTGNGRVVLVIDEGIKAMTGAMVCDISDLPKDSYFELPSYEDRQNVCNQINTAKEANKNWGFYEIGAIISNVDIYCPEKDDNSGDEFKSTLYTPCIDGEPSFDINVDPVISMDPTVEPRTALNEKYTDLAVTSPVILFSWHLHADFGGKAGKVDPSENPSSCSVGTTKQWSDEPSSKVNGDWDKVNSGGVKFIMGMNEKQTIFL